MADELTLKRYEQLIASHLDAAYNLARWLTRNTDDAKDCVQDACLRALRGFDGYRGGDGRAWLLTIVRNTCYSFLQRRHPVGMHVEYDDEWTPVEVPHATESGNPERQLLREADSRQVEAALMTLSAEHREVLVLHAMEDMSYKQIADVAGVPIGTVMSRLSRARERLRRQLLVEQSA